MGISSDSPQTDRYKSWARDHVHQRSTLFEEKSDAKIARLPSQSSQNNTKAGGLDEKKGGYGDVPASAAHGQQGAGDGAGGGIDGGGVRSHSGGTEATLGNTAEDDISSDGPPSASPPDKSEEASSGISPIAVKEDGKTKRPLGQRMKAGSVRFFAHLKDALFHSWVNVLLVFVPIGIIVDALGLNPGIVFGMNAVAIVPLAGLLAFATEAVAARLGDTLGALLNVSFGNAVELIIFIIALVKNEIRIVQASLLGSILANLLLILGMAFLFGGLRYREQIYNSTVTQMSACLLSLSVMSLLLPVCFAILLVQSSD